MKRIKQIFIMMALGVNMLSAHKEPIHQYIVKQAYELLRMRVGTDIPGMHAHVGDLGGSFIGSAPWKLGYMTTGVWREDIEDVVFRYDIYQGLNYPLVSIAHFWDADDGDLAPSMFRLQQNLPAPLPPAIIDIGPFPNSYGKLLRYVNGGWPLWFPDLFYAVNTANNHILLFAPIPNTQLGVPLEYQSITEFYNSRRMNVRSDQTGFYTIFDVIEQRFLSANEVTEIIVSEDVRDVIVWEVLGRMCHLLGDLSVPAHAHRDEHGLSPDSYEDWMGGSSNPHLFWNYQNAGDVIDPYTSDNDPLHFLMYSMQQIADHFGSNGPHDGHGNDVLGGNPRAYEIAFLNSIQLSSLGGPTSMSGPWTTSNLENIRDKTFPFAIRATAGLLYWFARETGFIGPLTNVAANDPSAPIHFSLEQNYPNPFNPSTKIGFKIESSGYVSLRVFNVLGQEVVTLVNEEMNAGSYEVTWNAAAHPSGVYFCRLQAANLVQTRRMMLLR